MKKSRVRLNASGSIYVRGERNNVYRNKRYSSSSEILQLGRTDANGNCERYQR